MNKLKDMEVELKFPLFNHKKLIQKLDSVAHLKKRDDYQKDVYFIPPHRNFLEQKPVSEWLRLKESKDKSILNYKNWHSSDKKNVVSCDEFEVGIENILTLRKILTSLNFKEIITVEKIRTTWEFKKALVAVDNVTDLGYFIEVEAKGNFESVDEAEKYLHSVLKELKVEVGPQDFEGYPHSLLKKKNLL